MRGMLGLSMTPLASAVRLAGVSISTRYLDRNNPIGDAIIIEDFNDSSDWLAYSGAVDDSTDSVLNSNSILFSDAGSGVNSQTSTTRSIDTSTVGVMACRLKYDDDPDYQTHGTGKVRMRISGSYYDLPYFTGGNFKLFGEQWFAINSADIPEFSSLGQVEANIRVQPSSASPKCGKVIADALLGRAAGTPTVILTFDDIVETHHSFVRGELNSRDLKGTFYIPPDNVDNPYGTGQTRLSISQIMDLSNDGHCISLDGTKNDVAMTTLADTDEVISEYNSMKSEMISLGFPEAGLDHFCYPNGSTGIDGIRLTKPSVLCNGTSKINVPDNIGINVGFKVVGLNIPKITRVVSIDNATEITLDTDITTQTVDLMFVDDSGEFHGNKLQNALEAAGVKTGRTTIAGDFYSKYGIGNGQKLKLPGNSASNKTAAEMITNIDTAISNGSNTILYFHSIVPDIYSGLDMLESEFITLLDYIESKVNSDQLVCIGIDDLWARDGESREITE